MTQWEGKSKGTVLGYRIFVFLMRSGGVRPAYFILNFVALYYFLFLPKVNKSMSYYFRQRLGYSKWKTKMALFKSYYTFGQTIIDKVAITSGVSNKFSYEFDGVELLLELLKEKKGAVLISAHIGNFEIAEHFFGELDLHFQINLVTTDMEHSAIRDYLASVTKKSAINFIIIKDDLSHIFEINAALARNELVCFTGDRYFPGNKVLTEEFLGEQANFPAGPFLIASRLRVPVVFVYVMKEPKLHYHLYARLAEVRHRDEKALLRAYTESVGLMLKKYPYQWFNYFDFWDKRQ
ncbi:LpxL/LpxP family acyltransferase [Flavobacterium silvaticum]|uniref:Lipid A biosynthesis acyltransferase n=1 Tax=Flavobacterium silvaticum TaxID=1852020 RepID=A0A972FM05_9FLAO|nr:lipid A biosynthesis acyltransferase [Flavobacterium silvaticum]NMH27685.1 lipid A biosynthesis acyltransferase [Flavobacterium silvaticum]